MIGFRAGSLAFVLLTLILSLLLPLDGAAADEDTPNTLMIIGLDGAINPGTAIYVKRGIEEAKAEHAALIILRLDTPGGLGSSMRTIIKAILNSPVPVVVYVGPRGAGAASAGVMITVAGHVAAMARGTNIGAAHPVTAGGKDIEKTMSKKVVNDMASYGRGIAEDKGRNGEWVEQAIRESVSITAEEAREKYVVDLVVKDLDDLIDTLDGREVYMSGNPVTLKTKSLKRVYYHPGFRDRVLKTISDPNIAYILMMIGLAGLYFELSHPG
ncbi:MAG: nodulation protein NfeD, partial [Deltaproteobacteria bacterium]